jgi:hypothetical protein
MALLGEMTTISGKVIMSKRLSHVDEFGLTHSIAYAAQSPWLRHQSIKDNILFGYPYDETRYDAVIEACALRPDLDVLEDGDATEIGARSVIWQFLLCLVYSQQCHAIEVSACPEARKQGMMRKSPQTLSSLTITSLGLHWLARSTHRLNTCFWMTP